MGRRALCKKCEVERQKKQYWKDPEKFKTRNRVHSRKNQRRYKLREAFNMSLQDYDNLLKAQNKGCAICGREDSGSVSSPWLHVDHCHATQKIRGLLCVSCNNGLGRFRDDPVKLRAAADYIEKHST